MKTFFLLAVGTVIFTSCLAFKCSKCHPELCEDPRPCQYGVTKDACDCCLACYQGPGQYCGGPKNLFGVCAKEFTCVPLVEGEGSSDPDMVGTCVEEP